MDAPESTPPIVRPEGGPWPASSSSSPATPPAATVTLPPDGTTETAPTPAPDAPTTQDYAALIEAHGIRGISAGELASIYEDASHLIHRYSGNAFQEQEALGNDADVLRALARAGKDMKVYEAAFNRTFESLPQGTRLTTSPLVGRDLDAAIEQLLSDYVDTPTRRKLELAGALSSPEGREFLSKVALSKHRLTTALAAVDQAHGEVRTRTEAAQDRAALQALAPSVRAESDRQFKETDGLLWDQVQAAKEAGQYGTAQRLEGERNRRFQARYGKG